MNIFKSLAFASVSVLALTACTDEVKYTPAAPVGTPDAYMSYDNVVRYDLNEGQDNFSFYVYRANGKGAATVDLTCTAVNSGSDENGAKDEAVNFFSAPAHVDFADGETKQLVTVTFPFDQLIPYDNYKVTVKIEGSYTTDYALGQETFTLFYIPWQPVAGGEGNSMCQFVDVVTISWVNFGEDIPVEDRTWECPIQEHPKVAGYYRVAEPYAPKYNIWCDGALDGLYGYVALPDDEVRYMYVHAEDPEHVYFDGWWTGWNPIENWGYGQLYFTCRVANFLANGYTLDQILDARPEYFGTMQEGYLKMTASGLLLIDEAEYGLGFYSVGGDFELLLPGAERIEPEEPEVVPEPVKPAGTWNSIGTVVFSDGLLAPAFGLEEGVAQYEVEAYVDADNSSRFLLVNPYNNAFWSSVVKYPDLEYYLEFDCTNPEVVLVPMSMTGVYGNNQMVYVSDVPAVFYYQMEMSYDEILAEGFPTSYDAANKVITIGGESACFALAENYDEMMDYEGEGYDTKVYMAAADAARRLVNKCEGNVARLNARFSATHRAIARSYNNSGKLTHRKMVKANLDF